MTALQRMLIQWEGDKIYLFPAWPKDWDVQFKLPAPQNTVVNGEVRDGKIEDIKVTPSCREQDVVLIETYNNHSLNK